MQQDLSSGMAVLAVWPFMNQQDLSSAMAVRPFTNQTGKFFMVVAAQLVWLLGGGGEGPANALLTILGCLGGC